MTDEGLARYLFRSVGPNRLAPYVSFLSAARVPAGARTVEALHGLLALDRDVRPVMLGAIDSIETQLKAQCARAFECELGALGLNDPANFKNARDYRNTMRAIEHEVARGPKGAFCAQGPESSGVSVADALEVATLGSVSRLYGNVRSSIVAREIARSFSTNRRCLTSWLKTVNQARNSFAHFKPYVVRKQIPSVPKPIEGVRHDNAAPLHIVYVVARLLAGMCAEGGEWDRLCLRRFECDAMRVLGRFAWDYPELAECLKVPADFANPYIERRLPKAKWVGAPGRVGYSSCRLADVRAPMQAGAGRAVRLAA